MVNEDLMPAVEGKNRENRRFTITSLHFLKFHGHFFTKLCLINLSFGDCVHLRAEDAYGRTRLKRPASALDFLI